MSVALLRHAKLENIVIKTAGALDEQGRQTLATGVTVQGFAVRVDDVVRMPTGEEVKTQVTVFIDAGQSTLPSINDRVETADGFAGIVVARSEPKGLQGGSKDHIEIKLREV